MDIVTALATLSQAIKIAKDLRDIEKDLDSAAYKAKMAELYNDLSDVKMALTDAREAIHEREQKIKILETKIEALSSGENCPLCQNGRMKITASVPHRQLGIFGVQERTLRCQNPDCGHTEKRNFDPSKQ